MGFVVGPVYIHPALLKQPLENTEIFAQMAKRRGEREAHGLYRGTVTRANAQAEAPWGELSNDLGLLHHDEGMAREGRHDRGSQLDMVCMERRSSEDGHAIKACPASGHPGSVQPQLFGLLNTCEHLTHLISTDSNTKQPVWHTLASL